MFLLNLRQLQQNNFTSVAPDITELPNVTFAM